MTAILKLTIKQEAFCKRYIELGNASEAYRQVYDCTNMADATIHVKASELLKDGKVTVRVKELQAVLAKSHSVTLASLLAELEEAKTLAMYNSNFSAMVSAVMAKAKLLGFV